MKRQMYDYINYCLNFVEKVDVVINNRGVLPCLQEVPGMRLMTASELSSHSDICYCCIRILDWLSKINLESDADKFDIDDFYEFRDGMCELNELLSLMVEYYEMSLQNKIDVKSRRELEEIRDKNQFIEIFNDMKISISEKSREDILNPPIKEVEGLNLYIELGEKSLICKGMKNTKIRDLKEYKEFKKLKDLDSLMALLRTGEVETLFKGCIAVDDYDVFSEIAESEVKLRGSQAHYVSWKLFLNKLKYEKISSVADEGSFLLLYSTIDNVDGDIYCEYNGMDIEVSQTKFRNYSGIFRGSYEDKRGSYKFIVDTNAD